jgi:hypothetical protein
MQSGLKVWSENSYFLGHGLYEALYCEIIDQLPSNIILD